MLKSVIRQEAAVLIIFGGIGDLSKRKLVPAIFNLMKEGWLPGKFKLLCVSYHEEDTASLKGTMKVSLKKFSRSEVTEEAWTQFANYLEYFKTDFNESSRYVHLLEKLDELDLYWGINSIKTYYLSVSPKFIEPISENLHLAGATRQKHLFRIVVEKPFGHDYKSAKYLNRKLDNLFTEKQIFRIDHYLGKETVQNILAFRFANSMFEPIWNRNFIDHIQITVSETVGVEHRGNYYDHSGALRDMMQNHILQLLCMVTMEPPITYDSDDIRNRKVDILHALKSFSVEDIKKCAIRGQYSAGEVEGDAVLGYRESPKVSPFSNTETFAAIKVFIDNWRWKGVPIYLRTGKALPQKNSSVAIVFKPVSHKLFPVEIEERTQSNYLLINIQPEEGMKLCFQAKKPGLDMALKPVEMTFQYHQAYEMDTPEAYETLLLDIMEGDTTLFMRADEVESAWKWITPVLDYWQNTNEETFPNYQAGSWGPDLASKLIEQDGRHWII